MSDDIKTTCVPVYDRPTDLADGEHICHACGQVHARDGPNNHDFCWSCAPVTDDRADDGPLTWTNKDILATLEVAMDSEPLAILRMAYV